MKVNTTESAPKHPRIVAIEEGTDILTGRAGLALSALYLDGIGLHSYVKRWPLFQHWPARWVMSRPSVHS